MKFEKPKSLTELVTDEIRNRIVSGDVNMGSLLSEVRFAKILEVSRTPIREAFNRLEMEGLVRTVPQRGTFVFELAPEEMGKISDVRVCLETAALRNAFAADRDGLVNDLTHCVEVMTTARSQGDDGAYLQADTVFHQILFDRAGNRFLNDAYQTIASKMAALRNRLGNHPDHMSKSFKEHKLMADQIASGDLDAAEQTLIQHIGRKEGSYWNQASIDASPD